MSRRRAFWLELGDEATVFLDCDLETVGGSDGSAGSLERARLGAVGYYRDLICAGVHEAEIEVEFARCGLAG